MISPLARRWRLAVELRRLREEAGLTSKQLADLADPLYRQRISALENARQPVDIADVHRVLHVLGVTGLRWRALTQIATDATARGWWESYRDIGRRQSTYVDLETGAKTVREYQLVTVPALLQTVPYSRYRAGVTLRHRGDAGTVELAAEIAEPAIEARQMRQRALREAGGPHYEAIIDEVALRRRSASPEIMADQFDHLAKLTTEEPRVVVRVLPSDANIGGYRLPRSAFSIYTYPDPEDLTMVAVDTEIEDHVYHRPDEVRRYTDLYADIERAAKSAEESAELLRELATEARTHRDT